MPEIQKLTEDTLQLDTFFFYAEANIVCITILVILLINDRLYNTRQEKQIWFSRTIVAHILYFVSDIGWAAVLYGHLPKVRALVVLFNFLNYILLSLVAFEWFMYMGASEGMHFNKSKKQLRLCLLPMHVSVVGIVIAYIAAPTFWVSESGELNPLYYPFFIAAPVLYLLSAFVFSIINVRKTESKEKKRLFLLIGIYPLGVLFFGLIQTFKLNAPLFCFGCTIMMVFFYIQNMQSMISVDSLTRLNNRGQINRYMEQARFRENVRTWIMMIDIDHFKEINDTFGHAEGDQALILVSDVLKQAVDRIKSPAFIGRYGGDEFTVLIQSTEEEDNPETLAAAIRGMLQEKQQGNCLPYDLKVSIGYDFLKDKEDTMDACLVRADENCTKTNALPEPGAEQRPAFSFSLSHPFSSCIIE